MYSGQGTLTPFEKKPEAILNDALSLLRLLQSGFNARQDF
jgi:hypothetical protein